MAIEAAGKASNKKRYRILDTQSAPKMKIDYRKYIGRGEKMFQIDAKDYIKEIRSDDRI